jgi:hypothetical protein
MFNVRWKEEARRGERKMKETDPLSMENWWPPNFKAQIKELNIQVNEFFLYFMMLGSISHSSYCFFFN